MSEDFCFSVFDKCLDVLGGDLMLTKPPATCVFVFLNDWVEIMNGNTASKSSPVLHIIERPKLKEASVPLPFYPKRVVTIMI